MSLPLPTAILRKIHVSGIIAVVVAGILKVVSLKITLLEAKIGYGHAYGIDTVNFVLNGSVFVLLGIDWR